MMKECKKYEDKTLVNRICRLCRGQHAGICYNLKVAGVNEYNIEEEEEQVHHPQLLHEGMEMNAHDMNAYGAMYGQDSPQE